MAENGTGSVGFIGLGTMGREMVRNLLKAGHAVTVFDIVEDAVAALAAEGAIAATSLAEAVADADLAITMLPDTPQVEDVIYGEGGLLASPPRGRLVVDMSTIAPAAVRRMHADLKAKGIDFIDAPVTGSKPAAIDGTLLFMAGGDRETVAEHEELLLAMGREVIYMGPSGNGANAKLAHNTIVGINAAGLIEGMAIAAKSGIDASAFLRVVQGGGAASKQAELKGRKIIEEDYSVQFSLELMLKDLKLSSVLTDTLGVSTPMLESAKSLFQLGQAAGYGEQDLAALARVYESWIGRRIGESSAAAIEAASPAEESDPSYAEESERRKKARVPLDIPLMMSIYQWEGDGAFRGHTVRGRLLDLSEDGIQIESKSPLEKDMFIVLHFLQESQLPPMTARIIRIERNNDAFSYGCLLTGLPLYQRLQLQEYIAGQH